MSGTEESARLRREFDSAFAAPRQERGEAPARFLCVTVDDGPLPLRYGLPLVTLAGVERGRRVVPLPGAPRALLGVSAIRGRLVSVWSLPALLGLGVIDADAHRIVLVGSPSGHEEIFGLAVGTIGDVVDVLLEHVAAGGEGLVAGTARGEGFQWPILDTQELRASVGRLAAGEHVSGGAQ